MVSYHASNIGKLVISMRNILASYVLSGYVHEIAKYNSCFEESPLQGTRGHANFLSHLRKFWDTSIKGSCDYVPDPHQKVSVLVTKLELVRQIKLERLKEPRI